GHVPRRRPRVLTSRIAANVSVALRLGCQRGDRRCVDFWAVSVVLRKALYLTNGFPMSRAPFLAAALSVIVALPAAAQNLTVEFQEGRVPVAATAVPVRTILTEWGKVGGTKIVGAEKITGLPLTVKLIDVTEAQALETILRSVAGYMAAPRHTGT